MGGSCEGIDVEKGFDLAAVYREAIDMASVAVASMDNYAADATIRANLQTWFGIKEDPVTHAVSAASVARFAKVKSTPIRILGRNLIYEKLTISDRIFPNSH